MRDATILIDDEGGTQPTSSDIATRETVPEGYRRLSLVAGVMFGVVLVFLTVSLVESLASDIRKSPAEFSSALVALLFSLAVAIGSRRRLFPSGAFATIALTTQVVVSLSLSAQILGWQHRLGPETLAWLIEGGSQPFNLGVGQVPWVGLWVVLFATVIPLRPGQHLLGALLSISALLFGPFLSTAVSGYPAVLEGNGFGATLHVSVWLFFRGAVAAGMAYFAARSVHGLRKRLARARTMGSYHLKEKLGEGGMGEVWKADHNMLARSAAIKLIKPESGTTDTRWTEVTSRFEREVRATAQLRSPRTIEVYDYGMTEDGTFYYVMELLDGFDLEELIKSQGPLTANRAVYVLSQICHSLGEAHDRGVIHRDIKPANIFLCRIGRDLDQIKVLDFGLVKTTSAESADTGLTQQGMFVGTPSYAAPEVASASGEVGPQSDLYSLGCVAYWLLTGKTVFEASSPLDMLIRHAKEVPSAPSQISELEFPPTLDQIVLDCLAKNPLDRPSSADDLAARLAGVKNLDAWTPAEAGRWWGLHKPVTGGQPIA